MTENKKQDGFKDEQYIVIPTEAFSTFAQHPLVKGLYLTDVGFFPHALHHYRERRDGADEWILLYCTEGEGYVQLDGRIYTVRPGRRSASPCTRDTNITPARRIPGASSGYILKEKT